MKWALVIVAAVVLTVGAYMPMISLSHMGLDLGEMMRVMEAFDGMNPGDLKQDMNLFELSAFVRRIDTGKMEGIALVGVAWAAVVVSLLRLWRTQWFMAACAAGVPAFSVVNMLLEQGFVKRQLADTPELARKVIESAHLRWGWLVLLAGVGLSVASAAVRGNRRAGGQETQ